LHALQVEIHVSPFNTGQNNNLHTSCIVLATTNSDMEFTYAFKGI
jgi:hypothetical protein